MQHWAKYVKKIGAGILPWTIYQRRIHILAGCECVRKKMVWCDFGGHTERSDATVGHAALREFLEESWPPAANQKRNAVENLRYLRTVVREMMLSRDLSSQFITVKHSRPYHLFLVFVPAKLYFRPSVALNNPEKVIVKWLPFEMFARFKTDGDCLTCSDHCMREVVARYNLSFLKKYFRGVLRALPKIVLDPDLYYMCKRRVITRERVWPNPQASKRLVAMYRGNGGRYSRRKKIGRV